MIYSYLNTNMNNLIKKKKQRKQIIQISYGILEKGKRGLIFFLFLFVLVLL